MISAKSSEPTDYNPIRRSHCNPHRRSNESILRGFGCDSESNYSLSHFVSYLVISFDHSKRTIKIRSPQRSRMSVHDAIHRSDFIDQLSPYLGILLTTLITISIAALFGTTVLV